MVEPPSPPPRSDVPPSPSCGSFSLPAETEVGRVGGAAGSPRTGAPIATPIPISRNWRRRMLARWPGERIHARWICAAVARCPVAQAMFSPSDQPRAVGVAGAQDAVDHVGRRPATRARRSASSTMSREWPSAAARSCGVLLERGQPAGAALAVVQAQHRGADRARGWPRSGSAPAPAQRARSAVALGPRRARRAARTRRRRARAGARTGRGLEHLRALSARTRIPMRVRAREWTVVRRRLRGLPSFGASRDVAQPGSAPALGAGGRRFKSSRPDLGPRADARGRGDRYGRFLTVAFAAFEALPCWPLALTATVLYL